MFLYLVHYDTLLQNATDIIAKYDSYFFTKYDKSLLQNPSNFLLQNATVSLQNVAVITKCDDFITKCESHKMPRLLQKCVGTTSAQEIACFSKNFIIHEHL